MKVEGIYRILGFFMSNPKSYYSRKDLLDRSKRFDWGLNKNSMKQSLYRLSHSGLILSHKSERGTKDVRVLYTLAKPTRTYLALAADVMNGKASISELQRQRERAKPSRVLISRGKGLKHNQHVNKAYVPIVRFPDPKNPDLKRLSFYRHYTATGTDFSFAKLPFVWVIEELDLILDISATIKLSKGKRTSSLNLWVEPLDFEVSKLEDNARNDILMVRLIDQVAVVLERDYGFKLGKLKIRKPHYAFNYDDVAAVLGLVRGLELPSGVWIDASPEEYDDDGNRIKKLETDRKDVRDAITDSIFSLPQKVDVLQEDILKTLETLTKGQAEIQQLIPDLARGFLTVSDNQTLNTRVLSELTTVVKDLKGPMIEEGKGTYPGIFLKIAKRYKKIKEETETRQEYDVTDFR